jgi:LytR cell envelope-related transcriptional attenuator
VEHVQPIDRTFSSRPTTFVLGLLLAVVLMAVGALVLLFQATGTRTAGTRPVSDTGRVSAGHATKPAQPLRPRARTSVLVLNGNGVSGAAGTEAAAVLARGYAHAIPTDAPASNYARSLVLFRPGWQREAERLARDAGIRAVAPLDGSIAPAYAHVPLVLILGAN